MRSYFVTGTDTDVGKTVGCDAILQAANQQGKNTLAYKPIAAGCSETTEGLRNQDALTLQRSSSVKVDYSRINPIAFKAPIAPHIAAANERQPIQLSIIDQGFKGLQEETPDLLIIEGAGGWLLPLNDDLLLSDWVIAQQLPVILIVGMKLGCLNHALLTYQTIISSGLPVAGWIANQVQPEMPFYSQNIALLTAKIKAPLLGEIPHLAMPESSQLGSYINVKSLL